MRWLLVLLVLPLASAEVVHDDPLDDQDAPHPALLKEFDIDEVRVANQTSFHGSDVRIGVAYECSYTVFATNRTTRYTFTIGNETVRQGAWESTLDSCRVGQATGAVLEDECLITGIFVEAVWEREDGVQVLDRAPDTGGLTFDACAGDAPDRQASNATGEEDPDPAAGSAGPEGDTPAAERQVPTDVWLGLLAIALAARRRF